MDDFSIRSILNSFHNIIYLEQCSITKENGINDLLMCFEAVFGQPWVGCFVCSGKLETKKLLM